MTIFDPTALYEHAYGVGRRALVSDPGRGYSLADIFGKTGVEAEAEAEFVFSNPLLSISVIQGTLAAAVKALRMNERVQIPGRNAFDGRGVLGATSGDLDRALELLRESIADELGPDAQAELVEREVGFDSDPFRTSSLTIAIVFVADDLLAEAGAPTAE